MRPHFLIVGACKAGTTSLYDDLSTSSDAGMPSEKEPDILHRATTEAHARQLYLEHFSECEGASILGDGSTMYSMCPEYPSIATFAKEVCGPALKIVYLVREPYERISSHLAHDCMAGRIIASGVSEALRSDERYINWTDYALQLEPWVSCFGPDQVLVVSFTSYIQSRQSVAEAVGAWVGLDPHTIRASGAPSNQRGTKRLNKKSMVARVANTDLYRLKLRKAMPERLKARLKHHFSSNVAAPEIELSDSDRLLIRNRLGNLEHRLKELGIAGIKFGWSFEH